MRKYVRGKLAHALILEAVDAGEYDYLSLSEEVGDAFSRIIPATERGIGLLAASEFDHGPVNQALIPRKCPTIPEPIKASVFFHRYWGTLSNHGRRFSPRFNPLMFPHG